ncbi:MAG: FxLD family lanthipeptide [Pseudonocardiaceae bacterium]
MSATTMELKTQTGQTAELDPFDLDIRVIESGDTAATLINLTDDGCGSTCANPCATNVA